MTKAADLANLIGNINAGGGGVNRNLIINGAMNVAQRGTSETGVGTSKNNAYHTVDRFRCAFNNTDGQVTMTQDSSAPEGFANSIKLACTTADTSIAADEYFFMDTKLEGQNLQTIAKGTSSAKPLALSFYVKGNASATYVVELYDSDNNRNLSKSFSVTTDWQRVEIAIPADTTGTFDDDNAESLGITFWLHAGSNFTSGTLDTTWGSNTNANRAVGISSFFDSTDRTFFITGVQLEVGQNPTTFEHEPFEMTMRKCQRYFQKTNAQFHLAGRGTGSTTGIASVPLTVPLRASPTTLDDNGLVFRAYTGSAVDIGDGTVPTVASFAETDNILLLNMLGFDNISDDRIANFQLFGTQNATTGFTMDSEL
jgi:hypothetical protein